jgi:hypothetical protein
MHSFRLPYLLPAEVSEWTEGEYRDQLCWCLDGKASEYYALLVERNQDMAYKNLIIKIEKRPSIAFRGFRFSSGGYLGLHPLPGIMGVYRFLPLGPSRSPLLGRLVPFPSPPCTPLGTSCAGAWMGKLANIMPYWWNETRIWHIRT